MKEKRLQRGQAMVLMALAFIGLAGFIGLAVDTGILFIQIGHLRRAVDAASLAAANQFREGRTIAQIDASSDEFVNLNSLNPASADVFICDFASASSDYHDASLCPCDNTNPNPDYHCPCILDPPSLCQGSGIPPRKYVKVEATMPVNFSFLPIIGWGSIDITADAISEAASVDLVLSVDTSPSMAYDAACDDADDDDGDGVDDDCDEAQFQWPGWDADPPADPPVGWDVPDSFYRDPHFCNRDTDLGTPGVQSNCHPFEEVRTAALALVDRLYFPYDRMAIVTFDRNAIVHQNLTSTKADITNVLTNLTISRSPRIGGPECPDYPPDPRGCTSTNTADGLIGAGDEFGLSPRSEAVWIVILLSDGGANAATGGGGAWVCPGGPTGDDPTWAAPFCRDNDFESGNGAFGYDAEDAAVDAALFVGCPDALSPQPAGCPAPGQAAVIFTIGLGDLVVDNPGCNMTAYPGGCEADQGEKLLRYVAGVGDDGDPDTPPAYDPCFGITTGDNCGNYYFAPVGADLLEVFEAIAARIFTRITH